MWVCGWVVISMTFTSWQVHSLVGRVTSVFYVVYTNWSVKFACRLPCCFYPCLTMRNSKHKNEGFNMAKFVPQSMVFVLFGLATHCKPKSRFWYNCGQHLGCFNRKCCCSLQVWMDSWAIWILTRREIRWCEEPSMEALPPFFHWKDDLWFGSSVDQNKFHSSFGSLEIPRVFCFSTVFSSKQFNMFHIVPLFFSIIFLFFFRTGRLVNWIILTL